MADIYYAWSNFKKTVSEQGQVEEWILCGDEISQGDLGIGDTEWQYLVSTGVVSTKEYPPVPGNVPPIEYERVNDEKKALLEEAAAANPVTGPGLNAPVDTIMSRQTGTEPVPENADANADADKQQAQTPAFMQDKKS